MVRLPKHTVHKKRVLHKNAIKGADSAKNGLLQFKLLPRGSESRLTAKDNIQRISRDLQFKCVSDNFMVISNANQSLQTEYGGQLTILAC